MSKIVKLLTAVLVLGFLVGCGSSGSSGDGDKLSFANISSNFPAFDESGETVGVINSVKDYRPVSASLNSTFFGALAGKGFIDGGGGYYYKNYTDYNASVQSFSLYDTIRLELRSVPSVAHTDALYASIFPALNTDVDGVSIYKQYIGDLAVKFNAYHGDLRANGWIDTSSGGYWKARKTIDSLTYDWYGVAYGTYSHSQWEIHK